MEPTRKKDSIKKSNVKVNFFTGAAVMLLAGAMTVVLSASDLERYPALVIAAFGMILMAEVLMMLYTRPHAVRDYFDTRRGLFSLGATLMVVGVLGFLADEPVLIAVGILLALSGMIVIAIVLGLRIDSSEEGEFAEDAN